MNTDLAIYCFLLIQLSFVSYIDWRERIISNYWSLLNLALFVGLAFLFKSHYTFHIKAYIFPLAFFIVGFFLFRWRVMGAGDAKYLSGLFLITPLQWQGNLLTSITYTTVVVATIFFVKGLVKNHKKLFAYLAHKEFKKINTFFLNHKIPYAPVILLAWAHFGVNYFNWLDQ